MIEENDYIAVFNSANVIMKAEQSLLAKNMHPEIIASPKCLNIDCSLALQILSDEFVKTKKILDSKQIPVIVYAQYINNEYKKLT